MKKTDVTKEEWNRLHDECEKVIKRLRNSGYDLSKILIAPIREP